MGAAGLRVLLVDDDPVITEMYLLALTRAGFVVTVANDGAVGLESALEQPPDVMFVDIRMPRIDGVELLRRLREDRVAQMIPVVVLSNFDDPALVAECKQLGAKDNLLKAALDPTSLASIVARVLAKPT